MKIRRLLVVLLMLSATRALAAIEIIQLNHRMADELLPMARSVIGDDGRINAYGNQLIVNAPVAQLQELRELLKQLDTPPRRLLITVDSGAAGAGEWRGYAVDDSVGAGDVEVQAGRGQTHGENRVRILNRSTDSWGDALQQIQVTEGYPALIQTGQSMPVHNIQVGLYGQVYHEPHYRDVTRGVYVTARISGDIVHITLNSNNDRLDPSHPGVIDIQTLNTQVSGRLGEWIYLGNASQSRQSDHQKLLRQHFDSTRQELSMRLKVETLK